MNSLQRYQKMLRNEAVDFLPRILILMQFAAEYIGSNYGAFASDHRMLVQANLECQRDFDFDQVSTISDPYRETEGFGARIEYQENAVPRCVTPPLRDNRDLTKLPCPAPMESTRMRDRIDAVSVMHEAVGGSVSILGWVEGPAAEAADLRDVCNFLMDTMDDPDYCCALMDRCLDVAIAFALAQIDAGADTIGIGDAISSQVQPGFYEAYIQPREKRLVDAIQARGAAVRLHICGDITRILPGIAELGIDILDVDHMVDLASVREIVGASVVLAGNVDPVATVAQGKPAQIREAVRRCYEACGMPFMVNAGCEIPSGTPNDNLRTLCEPFSV